MSDLLSPLLYLLAGLFLIVAFFVAVYHIFFSDHQPQAVVLLTVVWLSIRAYVWLDRPKERDQ